MTKDIAEKSTEELRAEVRECYNKIKDGGHIIDINNVGNFLNILQKEDPNLSNLFTDDEWYDIFIRLSRSTDYFSKITEFVPANREQFYNIVLETSRQATKGDNLLAMLELARDRKIVFSKDELYQIILNKSQFNKKCLYELFTLAAQQEIEFSQEQFYEIMLALAKNRYFIDLNDKELLLKMQIPISNEQWFDVIQAAIEKKIGGGSGSGQSPQVSFFMQMEEQSDNNLHLDADQYLQIILNFIKNDTTRNHFLHFLRGINKNAACKTFSADQLYEIYFAIINAKYGVGTIDKMIDVMINPLTPTFSADQITSIICALPEESESVQTVLNILIKNGIELNSNQFCAVIFRAFQDWTINTTATHNLIQRNIKNLDQQQLHTFIVKAFNGKANDQTILTLLTKIPPEKLDFDAEQWSSIICSASRIRIENLIFLLASPSFISKNFNPDQLQKMICALGGRDEKSFGYLHSLIKFETLVFTSEQSLNLMVGVLDNKIKPENIGLLLRNGSLQNEVNNFNADQLSTMLCSVKHIDQEIFTIFVELIKDKIQKQRDFFGQDHIHRIICALAQGEEENFKTSLSIFGSTIYDLTENQLDDIFYVLAKAKDKRMGFFLRCLQQKSAPTPDQMCQRMLFLLGNDITNKNLSFLIVYGRFQKAKNYEAIKLSDDQWKVIFLKAVNTADKKNFITLLQLLKINNPDRKYENDLENLIPYSEIKYRADLINGMNLIFNLKLSVVSASTISGVESAGYQTPHSVSSSSASALPVSNPDQIKIKPVKRAPKPKSDDQTLKPSRRKALSEKPDEPKTPKSKRTSDALPGAKSKKSKKDTATPASTPSSPTVTVKLEDQEYFIDPEILFSELTTRVRGKSNADLNCTHLATDIVSFLSSGKYPTEPSKTTKFSTRFFRAHTISSADALSSSDQVRIKQEEDSDDDMGVGSSVLYSTVDEVSKFFEKPINFIFPRETTYTEKDGEIVAIPQILISDDEQKEERIYHQYSTTYDQLTDILKARAAEQLNKSVCGLVNFAPKDQNQIVGHQIAFYATADQVYYFDAQLMNNSKFDPENPPVTTNFEQYFKNLDQAHPVQDRVFYMLAVAKTLPELAQVYHQHLQRPPSRSSSEGRT
ncbi:MAG: hypothetical protein V4612_00735 [Pseudomonadota bacterium]